MTYYLGLDAGTNSIGWACTDPNFELLKNNAGDMWVLIFFLKEKFAKRDACIDLSAGA